MEETSPLGPHSVPMLGRKERHRETSNAAAGGRLVPVAVDASDMSEASDAVAVLDAALPPKDIVIQREATFDK